MAEFRDGSLWMRLAFLTMIIGFILDLFGFAIGIPAIWGDTVGLLIAGYIFFLTATFLILALAFLDEAKGNMPALICFIITSILAGLLTVIGIAIWGGNTHKYTTAGGVGTYSAMVACCGSLLAILAGIFAILEIVGVGSGSRGK